MDGGTVSGVLCVGLGFSAALNFALIRIGMSIFNRWEIEQIRVQAMIKEMDQLRRALAAATHRPAVPSTFTPDELQCLVRLCHPDLHPASRQAEANEMMKRILEARTSTR